MKSNESPWQRRRTTENLSVCAHKIKSSSQSGNIRIKTVDAKNQKTCFFDVFFFHLIEECERRKSHPNLINVNLIRNSNKCVRLQNDCKIDAKEKRTSYLYLACIKAQTAY